MTTQEHKLVLGIFAKQAQLIRVLLTILKVAALSSTMIRAHLSLPQPKMPRPTLPYLGA